MTPPVRTVLRQRAPLLAPMVWATLASSLLAQNQPPTPAPPTPQQTPAPTSAPPAISVDDPDYGEPFSGFLWLTSGTGNLLPGKVAAAPQNQKLALPGARPRSPGGSVSMPGGKFNHLELSYFQADGSGTSTATTPLSLFGNNVPQGDVISTTYRVREAQLTWNYLNWPVPPEDSKWRLRTLWSFHYVSDSVTVDAPYEANVNFQPPHGTRNIFYPSFGIELEYIPSKHVYFQGKAWGFGLPHRADIADAEGELGVRIKHFEIFAGYKYFHLKTSPQSDQYFVQTLKGELGGIRWVFR